MIRFNIFCKSSNLVKKERKKERKKETKKENKT
jgi:hypothetical protein